MTALVPSISADLIWRAKTAFAARPDLVQTRMLGFRPVHQDAVTTMLPGLLNGLATVRHRSGVTPAILQTFSRAGLVTDEDLHTYETADEAWAAADRLIAEGYRLTAPYPLPGGRFADDAQLVPPALWRRLNAKRNLPAIVATPHLARRLVVTPREAAALPFDGPVWVKAGGEEATGWGFAVRHCPDAPMRAAAIADLAALGVAEIILEEDVAAVHSWCVSLVLGEAATLFAGATLQTFAAPGRQSGSVVDPAVPLPPAARDLALSVGEAARMFGFRGLAGLDIGLAGDGRLIVFDPNFRFNASTSQAMLHDAAAARSGLLASRSFHATLPAVMDALCARLDRPVDEGWFVPTRLLDAALLPAAEGRSFVTGFVLGHDAADTSMRGAALLRLLEGVRGG